MIARVRSDKLLRHGLLVMCALMASNVLLFVFHVVMVRQLGVIAYGTLYALISISTIALIPGAILSPVITKFAAEASAAGSPSRELALARLVAGAFLWLAVAYAGLGGIFALPLGAFFHVPAWAIFFNAVVTGAFAVSGALRAVVQGRQDFFGFSLATVVDGASRLFFGVLLVLFGFRIAGALGGLLIAGFLGTAAAAVRLVPHLRGVGLGPLHVDWRRVGMTTYGSAAATACVTMLSYGDVAIVKHFFDATNAGIYAAVSLDGKMVFFLVTFAPAVLLPKIVEQLGRGERTRFTLLGVLGLVFVLLAAGLLVFAIAPRLIVHVLNGDKFLAAIPYLLGYAFAMALLSVTNLLATYAIGIHRMAFAVPLAVVSLIGLAAIAAYHPSIGAVVRLLVLTNAAGLAAVALCVAAGGPTATARVEAVPVPPVG